ncbi:phage scaffolding protein [Pseudonocardia lutea]|uniref:Phage scaffolding protein n=1 Tax=Pseudonocardia lutea TaxID=2172015 RepID=A0ABW1I071_9PSEU
MQSTTLPLGYTVMGEPFWTIKGSEPDSMLQGEHEDGTEELDEDDDTDESDEDEGEWTPPTREEWEKVQRQLRRANNEAKKRRLRDKEKPAESEDAAARYKPLVIRAEAKAALVAAGLNDTSEGRVKKLLRMIDVEDIEIGDDGELDGLEDQIESIKEDWPELFKAQEAEKPRRRAPRVDASDRRPASSPKKSTAELIASRVHGR